MERVVYVTASWIMIAVLLTLKVLNFWKFTSYCSLKPLWSGMGEVVPARTFADPPSPIPAHCASIVATSTFKS